MLTLLYNDEHSSIASLHTDSSSLQEEMNTNDQGTSEIAETRVSDIKPDPDAGVSILSDIIHSEENVDLDIVKQERCSDDSSYGNCYLSDDEMADSRAESDTPSGAHTKEDIEMFVKNEGQEFSVNERNCVTPDGDDAHAAKREAEEEISTGPCFKHFKESLNLSMQCTLKREEGSDSGSSGSPNDNSTRTHNSTYNAVSVVLEHWSVEHRVFAVEQFFRNNDSVVTVQRLFRQNFNVKRRGAVPDRNTLLRWVEAFRSTGSVMKI